jgi:hypothetical protein
MPLQTSRRTAPVVVGIILVAAALGGLVGGWWKVNHPATPSSQAAGQPAALVVKSDFDKLKGQWVRPDGGYVLDIKSVNAEGGIDIAYLNPNPIHVSKAQASIKAGKLELFIELRDTNYPGNYYTLTYDAAHDQLVGVYYHLGIQQQFDVIFVRMK